MQAELDGAERQLVAMGRPEDESTEALPAVVEGRTMSYTQGQTTDRRFATFGARVAYLARHAARLAENPS